MRTNNIVFIRDLRKSSLDFEDPELFTVTVVDFLSSLADSIGTPGNPCAGGMPTHRNPNGRVKRPVDVMSALNPI